MQNVTVPTLRIKFVTGEIPVDPTMVAMFLRAAHPSKRTPHCFKGTAQKFLSAKAAMHTPPIMEVFAPLKLIVSYILHMYGYMCTCSSLGDVHILDMQ